jgi:hypothetical protein
MHEIELKSGYNDCYYNFEGKCIHPMTCRGKGRWQRRPRNWDSKENCTVTQLGTQLCSAYKREPI